MKLTAEKTNKILKLINDYAEVHPLATKCGAEYISQDDDAQIGALQLVCEIFDAISE